MAGLTYPLNFTYVLFATLGALRVQKVISLLEVMENTRDQKVPIVWGH